jgi:hypothetical protein
MQSLIILLAAAASGLVATATAAQDRPTVRYWHVWVDDAGVSHQEQCTLSLQEQTFAPPAAPLWIHRLEAPGSTVVFDIQPAGWQGTWHRNPKPQWIIPLSGRWYVQTMDGNRVEMGPGDVSFGEDQLARESPDGHVGHLSGTVGEQPAVLVVVQMDITPTSGEPCTFR